MTRGMSSVEVLAEELLTWDKQGTAWHKAVQGARYTELDDTVPQGEAGRWRAFERNAPVPALTGTGDTQSDHCGAGSGVFPGLSPPPLPSRQGSPMPQHLPL